MRALILQRHHLFLFPHARHYTTSCASSENWAAIRGEASEVPAYTATARYNNWVAEEVGVLPESCAGPVWSGEGRDFLAYGVDLPKVRNRPSPSAEGWVHSSFDNPAEYLDPTDHDVAHPELVAKIRLDLLRASRLLEFFDQRGGLMHESPDRSYMGEELEVLRGQRDILLSLRKARRIMDERLAGVNFGALHADPEVRLHFELTYAAYISKWHLLDSMRGIYLDLRTFDPAVTHLLDLFQRKVPVFYPYDSEFWPPISLEEARAAEGIRKPEEYAQWFVMQSRWPPLSKTRPLPLRIYGRTTQERHANPAFDVPKPVRFDQLVNRAKVVLTDILHSNLAPIVAPLANVSVQVYGAARLIVDYVTEIRMMLWAVATRSSNAAEILGEALLRGWPFQVVYPKRYLEELAGVESHSRVRDSDLFALPSVLSEDEDLLVVAEWQLYLARVLILLARPNAKAFLCLGGVYWRLAILLGGQYLLTWLQDVLGPSNHLVTRRTGTTVLQEYWVNDISEAEKDVLLGVVVTRVSGTRKSWFPPQELLEKYWFNDGEWSRASERLLLERYESLQRGESIYRPLTYEEWEEELSAHEASRLLRNSFVPVATYGVETFLVDLRVELGGSWNGISLAELDTAVDLDA